MKRSDLRKMETRIRARWYDPRRLAELERRVVEETDDDPKRTSQRFRAALNIATHTDVGPTS